MEQTHKDHSTATQAETQRPQHQETHTHTHTHTQSKTTGLGHMDKVQAWGPCIERGHVGRGPLLTSPGIGTPAAHRQADAPSQSASQPVCHTETRIAQKGLAQLKDRGASTYPMPLNCSQLFTLTPAPLPHTLRSCPLGLGLGHLAGGRGRRGMGPVQFLLCDQGGRC
jgi:hypothetical protein